MADLSENEMRLFTELFHRTSGDTAATVSMFELGESVGLSRDEAGAAGEELIGWGLVEVRTLSGGIAISDRGVEEANQLGLGGQEADDTGFQLGFEPVLEDPGIQAVDRIVSGIKSRSETLGLGFEPAAELIADVKTIDAQLASPRPKTAVVREVLRSILAVLESADAGQVTAEIRQLLGQ
ncbi:MAG: hypothetical protein PVG78_10655 [Desulfobacterales bacterium]|jgi:hypothetical protein